MAGKYYFAATCLGTTNRHFGFLVVADRAPSIRKLILAGAPAYLESPEIKVEFAQVGHELSRFLESTHHYRWLKLPRTARPRASR